MGNRDELDAPWDDLTDLLCRMRGGLEEALHEAQRRFAASVDEPFSGRATEAMVAAAMVAVAREQVIGAEDIALCVLMSDLVFTSDANLLTDDRWASAVSDEICSLVSSPVRAGTDHLMTRVNSTSIDLRAVRWSRLPSDRRTFSSADPIVLDVGAAFGELPSRHIRKVDEGTVCWDVRLEAPRTEVLDYAIAHSTSFDFSDYEDEVVKELLRN